MNQDQQTVSTASIAIQQRGTLLRSTVLVGAVLVAVLVGLYVYMYQRQAPAQNEMVEKQQAALEKVVAEIQAQPFVYSLVPDAPQIITVPPPPESNELDARVYAEFKSSATVAPSDVQNDVAFNLPFEDMTYGEYLLTLSQPSPISQVMSEVRQLTLAANKQYQRPALKERIADVTQIGELDRADYRDQTVSVYPSIRAVDAYLAGQIMATIDSEKADYYQKLAEALVARGIAYGLYGQSDADAAKALVEQYLTHYDLKQSLSAEATSSNPISQ